VVDDRADACCSFASSRSIAGFPNRSKTPLERRRDRVYRKRLQIDWVAVLINTTLFLALVMFLAVVGSVAWRMLF
jgi:hypothetical protein